MAVEYVRREPPASAEQVNRLEQRVGRPLPPEYRDYLRQQDGGRLDNNNRAINTVFGVGDVPEWASIWDVLETYSERVPDWLLPVADDAFGNLFAVSLRNQDRGSVWFWNHELEADEGEPPTEENLKLMAPSWPVFLDSLEKVDFNDIDED
jgi:cell wall assembly regulator SMI1